LSRATEEGGEATAARGEAVKVAVVREVSVRAAVAESLGVVAKGTAGVETAGMAVVAEEVETVVGSPAE